MRWAFSFLLTISFISVAVFGLFGMAAPEHHNSNFNACVGSLTQGVNCPDNDSLASSIFHLTSFKFFSNSPLAASTLWLSALTLLLLVALMAKAVKPVLPRLIFLSADISASQKIFETSLQPFKLEKIFWNSLHENSPSNSF